MGTGTDAPLWREGSDTDLALPPPSHATSAGLLLPLCLGVLICEMGLLSSHGRHLAIIVTFGQRGACNCVMPCGMCAFKVGDCHNKTSSPKPLFQRFPVN